MSQNTPSEITVQTKSATSATGGVLHSSNARAEFSEAVDELLDQLKQKFDAVSKEMSKKMDDMACRLDELEASLAASKDSEDIAETASGPESGK